MRFLLETSVAGAPTAIAKGVGNTWISLSARNSVAKYLFKERCWRCIPGQARTHYPPVSRRPDTNVCSANQRGQDRAGAVGAGAGRDKRAIDHSGDWGEGGHDGDCIRGYGTRPDDLHHQWQACSNGADANSRTSPGPHRRPTWPRRRTPSTSSGVCPSGQREGPGSSYSSLIGNNSSARATPVTGGQTVVIAEGVTLNLKSVKRTRAGVAFVCSDR